MMSSIEVVTKSGFMSKRWRWARDYRFASKDCLVPLVGQEFTRAALYFPIGFVRKDEGYLPVAVLGITAGQNLFVGVDGKWMAGYVPAAYRGYPFSLGQTQDNHTVLMVDTGSGLVSEAQATAQGTVEGQAHGETFFGPDDKPTEPVQKVFEFLQHLQANRTATQQACALLDKLGLIEPWPVAVLQDDGVQRQLEGLFRVDEQAFKQLALQELDALRQSDALPLVFCQLLSQQHMTALGPMAHQRRDPMTVLGGSDSSLDLEFLNEGGSMRFGMTQ